MAGNVPTGTSVRSFAARRLVCGMVPYTGLCLVLIAILVLTLLQRFPQRTHGLPVNLTAPATIGGQLVTLSGSWPDYHFRLRLIASAAGLGSCFLAICLLFVEWRNNPDPAPRLPLHAVVTRAGIFLPTTVVLALFIYIACIDLQLVLTTHDSAFTLETAKQTGVPGIHCCGVEVSANWVAWLLTASHHCYRADDDSIYPTGCATTTERFIESCLADATCGTSLLAGSASALVAVPSNCAGDTQPTFGNPQQYNVSSADIVSFVCSSTTGDRAEFVAVCALDCLTCLLALMVLLCLLFWLRPHRRCPFCMALLSPSHVVLHIEGCPKRTVECIVCGADIYVGEKVSHQRECSKRQLLQEQRNALPKASLPLEQQMQEASHGHKKHSYPAPAPSAPYADDPPPAALAPPQQHGEDNMPLYQRTSPRTRDPPRPALAGGAPDEPLIPSAPVVVQVAPAKPQHSRTNSAASTYSHTSPNGLSGAPSYPLHHPPSQPPRSSLCSYCGLAVEGMARHLNNACSRYSVPCAHCRMAVICKDRRQHESECPLRSVHCTYCGAAVQQQHMLHHESHACIWRTVLCTVCGAEMCSKDLKAHILAHKTAGAVQSIDAHAASKPLLTAT
eukprot:TRINITY_DN30143_c0_g1_i1.p1 TRINITY_DN30143_c0_g1~~TRINITY_DN30143_c0_g1_i1.p1  ORF type:complete len:618 (-),score=31.83 TRINITY_DN30143_c0_g1_i1:65-1918(-)